MIRQVFAGFGLGDADGSFQCDWAAAFLVFGLLSTTFFRRVARHFLVVAPEFFRMHAASAGQRTEIAGNSDKGSSHGTCAFDHLETDRRFQYPGSAAPGRIDRPSPCPCNRPGI